MSAMIGLLIIQMTMLRPTNGQFGGGGGPSTFGYDGSSACSKPYSRNGRARFEKLPCDFRRQNWCTVAGSAYPWHAVRRFVQENQGLMRRMYGDERHINILKAELEKNDIELEYDDRYQRYPDDARRFQYEDEYEFVNPEKKQRSKLRDQLYNDDESRSFTDETLTEPITERTRKYTKESVEYKRTNTRPSSESTTVPNSSSSKFTNEPGDVSSTSSSANVNRVDDVASVRTSTLSISLNSTTEPTGSRENDNSSLTMEKIASTLPAVTLGDIARIKNSSINEIPGQSDIPKIHDDNFDSTELPIVDESTKNIENTTLEPESTSTSSSSSSTASSSPSESIDRIDVAESNDEDFKDTSSDDQTFAANEQEPAQQQFRPRPEYRPTETKPDKPNMEGQLFQDVAAKDQQEQPVLKLRGVNACPVKEEVVAPFWANNTRGEVLALLNLYPFEQYVHWEKCTHENKQMYCRDGCRCEQQYRLHRLLAYDPNNECRGIFSDWFKFPSCCVCRCYDLPVEFRVTSRSPRIQKQKLRLRPPGNGRG